MTIQCYCKYCIYFRSHPNDCSAAAEADEAANSAVSVVTGSAPHVKQHSDKPKIIKHDTQKDILKNAVKKRSVIIRKKASEDSGTGSNHLNKCQLTNDQ